MSQALQPILYPQQMSFHEVARLLPFGTQWQLIDRVIGWSDEAITVQKAVSGGETNMAAHLRDGPSIMPGVLQIEFVNQATMLLMILRGAKGIGANITGGAGVLARCKANFHSPAYIGEVLTATVKVEGVVAGKTQYEGIITSGERKIATVSAIGALVTTEQPPQAIAA